MTIEPDGLKFYLASLLREWYGPGGEGYQDGDAEALLEDLAIRGYKVVAQDG